MVLDTNEVSGAAPLPCVTFCKYLRRGTEIRDTKSCAAPGRADTQAVYFYCPSSMEGKQTRGNKLDVYKRLGTGALAKFLSGLLSPVPQLEGAVGRLLAAPTAFQYPDVPHLGNLTLHGP